MDTATLADLYRHAALAMLVMAGPALAAGVVVGLGVGLVQALFNLQDQSLAFALKIVVILAVVGATGAWSIQYLATWAHSVFTSF